MFILRILILNLRHIYTISLSGFKIASSSCIYGCDYTVTYFMPPRWCCCQPQPFQVTFSLRILSFYNYDFQNSQGADRGFPFVLPLCVSLKNKFNFNHSQSKLLNGKINLESCEKVKLGRV